MGLLSSAQTGLRWLFETIDDFLARPDPANPYLNGVYAPVCETQEAVACSVEGTIPAAVTGQVRLRCTSGASIILLKVREFMHLPCARAVTTADAKWAKSSSEAHRRLPPVRW
jgi:hypothetical protein